MASHQPRPQSICRFTAFIATQTFVFFSLLVTGCAGGAGGHDPYTTSDEWGLGSLVLEGPKLHASLRTHAVDAVRHLPADLVLPGNPHLSDEDEFVEAIAGSSSQGRLDREGIRSALYAMYAADGVDLGVYGLEARSFVDADTRERALREIWAMNESLGRARVHRSGLVLVVVWHDGVSPECWESANASVAKRLSASGTL